MYSALSKARGLGSTKSGTHHWWEQRVSAIFLLPSGLWFIFAFIPEMNASYEEIVVWLRNFPTGVFLILFLSAAYYHTYLGLRVIIEDYVPHQMQRLGSLILLKGFILLLAISSILIILKFSVSF